MSDPEAQNRFVNYVADYAQNHSNVDYLHVWLGDALNAHCECDGCVKKTPSDWYVILLNMIDEEFKKRNLGTRIVFIMYADTITPSMRRAMDETERRREKQDAFNKANGIVPQTVIKSVRELLEVSGVSEDSGQRRGTGKAMNKQERAAEIARLEKAMKEAARMLEFELAASLRDQIIQLRGEK